jgi:hypothetical protein
MHRYRHFDDVIDANNPNSAAILPELDMDEPFQVHFPMQLDGYSSNFQKLKYYFSRRTRLERFLIGLTILLLIVLFIITLVSLYHSKSKSVEPLCLTPTCVQVSSTLTAGMNQSVDPCEDFHQFVCGNWIRKNVIPKGSSSWSTTRELAQKNMIILKNILEQASISSLTNVEYEAIKFYRSCMNTTELERLHVEPLEIFFQKSLNLTVRDWIQLNTSQTWERLFVRLTDVLSGVYDISNVLPVKVGSDEKNSTWNNIHVSFSSNVSIPIGLVCLST